MIHIVVLKAYNSSWYLDCLLVDDNSIAFFISRATWVHAYFLSLDYTFRAKLYHFDCMNAYEKNDSVLFENAKLLFRSSWTVFAF